MEINRNKSMDQEIKSHFEKRMKEMEQNYILKSQHQNILESQLQEIKNHHLTQVQELENKAERKFKELFDKDKASMESSIEHLRSKKWERDLYVMLVNILTKY